MQGLSTLWEQWNKQGIPVRKNVPLAPFTTFHIGGPIALFAEPQSTEQLTTVLRDLRQREVFSFVLGRGSNVLFPDEPIDGVAIRTCCLDRVAMMGHTVTAQSGATLASIARAAQKAALTGLELAHGIP